ncbi:MAG: dephospho-CoA kinase [Oscillospiraceae bacterium]|nr:dephospho-CoA kinase [Oscillospiraceae bacterium]
MTIVGVAGGTGSGKSTFCRLLASNIPDSTVIDGDAMLNEILWLHRDAFSQLLGEAQQLDSRGRLKLCFFTKNPLRIRDAVTIARGYLNGSAPPDGEDALTTAIATARDLMSTALEARLNSLTEDTVILDWANLPFLDVWRRCDLRILMNAEDGQRLRRLKKRNGQREFTEEELRALIDHAFLPADEIGCDIRIDNDRIETLIQKASEIGALLRRKYPRTQKN